MIVHGQEDPRIWWHRIGTGLDHEGPFTLYEMRSRLIEKQINDKTLCWCKGLMYWQELDSIDGLRVLLDDASVIAATVPVAQYREAGPWARCFARFIDILSWMLLITLLLKWAFPSAIAWLERLFFWDRYGIMLAMLTLPLVMLIDAVVLSACRTTLGKYLCGLHICYNDSPRLSLKQALIRNAKVYINGLAFGVVGLNLFTMLFAAKRLWLGRRTSWDEEGDFYVRQRPLAPWRWLLVMIVSISLVVLLFWQRML